MTETDETENDDTETTETDDAGDPRISKLRHEAAGYRRKLRETEAERDALTERVNVLRRGEVERLAGEQLADPSDLWRSGVELDSLLGEEGDLDPEAVSAAVEQIVGERPHYRKPAPDFDGGARAPAPSDDREPSFGDALKQASGR